MILEAYLHGTSTRKVDDLVKALGADSGISKSEVSRICADLDTEVAAFRDRTLAGIPFPYVFPDATYCKARVNHQVVSQAAVWPPGRRRGAPRGAQARCRDSEDGAFWTAFLRSLEARALHGVQLVISDAHAGLEAAIGSVLLSAVWQRSSGSTSAQRAGPGAQGLGGDGRGAHPHHLRPGGPGAGPRTDGGDRRDARPPVPRVEAMLRDAADDMTAFAGFPLGHWKEIWSTNLLERLNKKIKRRTDVVGIFVPNPEALLRLASAVLVEAHDEWQVGGRHYLSEGSMALLAAQPYPAEGGDYTRPAHGIVTTKPADRHTSKNIYTTPRDVTSRVDSAGAR